MDYQWNYPEMLNYVNPAQLTEREWVMVGMALKHENQPFSTFDEWSSRDDTKTSDGHPRYTLRSCQRAWNSFKETGRPVTGAYITKLAKAGGWHPVYRKKTPTNNNHQSIKIEPLDPNPITQLLTFLNTVFKGDEHIAYTTRSFQRNGKWEPYPPKGNDDTSYTYRHTADELTRALTDALNKGQNSLSVIFRGLNAEAGAWIRVNPMDGKGITDKNVTQYRYVLVESDSTSIEEQYRLYQQLNLPIATLVYSGGKSLHAIVKINADNRKEYDQRVRYLYDTLKRYGFNPDESDKNPSKLSRLPGVKRGAKEQFLVAVNIGAKDWSEWCWGIPDQSLSEEAHQLIKAIMSDQQDCNQFLDWLKHPRKDNRLDFKACGVIAYHCNQQFQQWNTHLINEVFMWTGLFDHARWYRLIPTKDGKYTTYGHQTIERAIKWKQDGYNSNQTMGWNDGFKITVKDGSVG